MATKIKNAAPEIPVDAPELPDVVTVFQSFRDDDKKYAEQYTTWHFMRNIAAAIDDLNITIAKNQSSLEKLVELLVAESNKQAGI